MEVETSDVIQNPHLFRPISFAPFETENASPRQFQAMVA